MGAPNVLSIPTAETVTFRGHNGDRGEGYYARPTRPGKFPGMVAVHHLPGWGEWIIDVVRKLAHHDDACRGGAECAVGARW